MSDDGYTYASNSHSSGNIDKAMLSLMEAKIKTIKRTAMPSMLFMTEEQVGMFKKMEPPTVEPPDWNESTFRSLDYGIPIYTMPSYVSLAPSCDSPKPKPILPEPIPYGPSFVVPLVAMVITAAGWLMWLASQ